MSQRGLRGWKVIFCGAPRLDLDAVCGAAESQLAQPEAQPDAASALARRRAASVSGSGQRSIAEASARRAAAGIRVQAALALQPSTSNVTMID